MKCPDTHNDILLLQRIPPTHQQKTLNPISKGGHKLHTLIWKWWDNTAFLRLNSVNKYQTQNDIEALKWKTNPTT